MRIDEYGNFVTRESFGNERETKTDNDSNDSLNFRRFQSLLRVRQDMIFGHCHNIDHRNRFDAMM